MLSKNIKFMFFIVCANIVFSHPAFSAPKNAQSLARINKEIEAKRKATNELEKKQKLLADEIKQTQKQMITIANNVKKYERQLSKYDSQLAELQIRERLLNTTIESNNDKLIKIIAVFENISLMPKGYLLLSQSRSDTIFYSSIMLKNLIDQLNHSKKKVSHDLSELINLKNKITDAKNSIKSLNKKVRGDKDKIANLIRAKQNAQKQLSSKQQQNKREIKKLVAESKTIEEFLKKAERLRKQREKEKQQRATTSMFAFPKQMGLIPLPVDGSITTYFGENRTKGVKSKGIYVKPRAFSQVISPSDAEVVFAGSFYGYKNLLILHSSDDYYIILGGMNNIFVEEGQSLLTGEPIGEMGDGDMYIETRTKDTPINPLRYFKV